MSIPAASAVPRRCAHRVDFAIRVRVVSVVAASARVVSAVSEVAAALEEALVAASRAVVAQAHVFNL